MIVTFCAFSALTVALSMPATMIYPLPAPYTIMLPFSAAISDATRAAVPLAASIPEIVTASYSLIPFPTPVPLILTYTVGTSVHSCVLAVYCRSTSVSPLWSIHSFPFVGFDGAVLLTVICVMS